MYFIDSRMGAAGDMLLGAFIDLNLIRNAEIIAVLESAGSVMGDVSVKIVEKKFGATRGTGLEITHEPFSHVSGSRMRRYMKMATWAVDLTTGKAFAKNILDAILQAEVSVHNSTMDDIILHETGSPDTLLDIVGIAYFYEKLRLYDERITGTPVSVGQGRVRIAHGVVDVPAPATAKILRTGTIKFNYGPHDGEMTTPTGAAILSQILQEQMEKPDFTPKDTGTGFGTRTFDGKPGFLQVMAD